MAHPTTSFERHRVAVRERLRLWPDEPAGPDSVTWKINRELIVLVGWGRAILLQLAHPAIAAGVHDHSTGLGSLAASSRRLYSTVGAMLSLTFGDTEQKVAAAAGINVIHDRVRGQVPASHATGPERPYSAHDADLQRWVHATLLDSMPLAYELLVEPLTAEERDRYCAEAAVMEPLLGMPAGSLPRDWAQLQEYLREMSAGGDVVVTDTSRALGRAVLYPPRWRLAWPAFRALQLLTIGTLPPAIRTAYGFEWNGREARAFTRWATALRLGRRLLPAGAREWPMARQRDAVVHGGHQERPVVRRASR